MDNVKNIARNARLVTFSGGEPLLVPEVIDILDAMDPLPNTYVTFSTNLTWVTDKFLNSIAKFPLVKIMVSLEGIEEHNDYIRYGSKWGTILENINKIKNLPNVHLVISSVLQHTSIYSLPKLLVFVNDLGLPSIQLNEIYINSYPDTGVLGINSAPPEKVNNFRTWLDNYSGVGKQQLLFWIDNYKYSPELNEKFNIYIDMLDQIRDTKFNLIFK